MAVRIDDGRGEVGLSAPELLFHCEEAGFPTLAPDGEPFLGLRKVEDAPMKPYTLASTGRRSLMVARRDRHYRGSASVTGWCVGTAGPKQRWRSPEGRDIWALRVPSSPHPYRKTAMDRYIRLDAHASNCTLGVVTPSGKRIGSTRWRRTRGAWSKRSGRSRSPGTSAWKKARCRRGCTRCSHPTSRAIVDLVEDAIEDHEMEGEVGVQTRESASRRNTSNLSSSRSFRWMRVDIARRAAPGSDLRAAGSWRA
jgi:hypothetical protein